MTLTKRQTEIYEKMGDGKWYNCKELGTSRTTLSILERRGLVEKERDHSKHGYLAIDTSMVYRRIK